MTFPVCAGCGTDLDNRSLGCKVCSDRHRRRRKRTRQREALERNPPPPNSCRGCGQPLYERTKGCETCYQRQRNRARRRVYRQRRPRPTHVVAVPSPTGEPDVTDVLLSDEEIRQWAIDTRESMSPAAWKQLQKALAWFAPELTEAA